MKNWILPILMMSAIFGAEARAACFVMFNGQVLAELASNGEGGLVSPRTGGVMVEIRPGAGGYSVVRYHTIYTHGGWDTAVDRAANIKYKLGEPLDIALPMPPESYLGSIGAQVELACNQ